MRTCTRTAWLGCALLVGLTPLAAGQDAVAIVNGRPISRGDFYETLVDAYGIDILQQLVLLDIAKAEARRRDVSVSRADVDAEYNRLISEIVEESGMADDEATEENKQKALDMVLAQRRLTRPEFMIGVERNAHLRKMVDQQIAEISEDTLREEFARTYGEKVRVRHIQVPLRDMARLTQVQTMLQRGRDFGEVARELSVNSDTAPRGGELPPFTFEDPDVDPALREMAFSLAVGEVSTAVRTDRYWHVLRLVERIAPPNVTFDDVRAEVERKLKARVIPERMATLAQQLYAQTDIRVIDGVLRRKWDELNQPGR